MPERRLVKERPRSSKARCGTAALAIFPVEGKSCCCQCGGSCVGEGVDAKVSFVRKSELQSLGLSVRIGLDLPNMQAAENGRIEPTLTDADRCPNDRNAQKADFANVRRAAQSCRRAGYPDAVDVVRGADIRAQRSRSTGGCNLVSGKPEIRGKLSRVDFD